jgi:hypothetical protein
MTQLPNVDCKYGAPMGRTEKRGDTTISFKFRLFRVRLDQGGYDEGGAYWGIGTPLYCAEAIDCEATAECKLDELPVQFFRSNSRDTAKAHITGKYPKARFFR